MAYINLGQVIYPVGAIYASANSTSPASLFGGSWTQITDAALRGATWVGYSGSDTHALNVNEMPSHRHKFRHNAADGPITDSVVVGEKSATTGGGGSFWTVSGSIFNTSITYEGGGSTYQRATLLQLLRLATHKLNLQEVMQHELH